MTFVSNYLDIVIIDTRINSTSLLSPFPPQHMQPNKFDYLHLFLLLPLNDRHTHPSRNMHQDQLKA